MNIKFGEVAKTVQTGDKEVTEVTTFREGLPQLKTVYRVRERIKRDDPTAIINLLTNLLLDNRKLNRSIELSNESPESRRQNTIDVVSVYTLLDD